jgi:hypothetical protein
MPPWAKEHDHHLFARSRIRNCDHFHAIARGNIGSLHQTGKESEQCRDD